MSAVTGEDVVFGAIKNIPIVNWGYGSVRALAYYVKGDKERAIESISRGIIAPSWGPGGADKFEQYFEGPYSYKWYAMETIQIHLKPGDLVEFDRTYFSHYALYLGDGKVMNCSAEDKSTTEAPIEELSLEFVCRGDKIRIRTHDKVAKRLFGVSPRSHDEIVRAAMKDKGKIVPYQLQCRNCEYYATFWRFGKGFSTQTARPSSTQFGIFLASAPTVGNVTVAKIESSKYEKYVKLGQEGDNDENGDLENVVVGNNETL